MPAIPTRTVDELLDSFEVFDEWEERYRYIIELGDELPPFPDELRTEANRVQGCLSNVWLATRWRAGAPPTLEFVADSDAQLVKGLVALLTMLYSGRSPAEILALDVETLFEKLGLKQHLSRSRANGLRNMVKRVRELAASA